MIIVCLFGGIGNQMFQYAYARALSLSTNKKLLLDISLLENSHPLVTKRVYSLNMFNIESILSGENTKKIISETTRTILETHPFKYDPLIINQIVGSVKLVGTWQSWKNFREINNVIFSDFSFKENYISNENLKKAVKIQQVNSVSIHIRRTDYLNVCNNFLGVLSINYYHNAIKYIAERISNPVFYIFSDDTKWLKSNIKISYDSHIIEGNRPIEDLYLMSQCKHNIIANSTFSWWGAWLNASLDKIVISPKIWFLGKNIKVRELDIIPEEWIIIDTI